MLAQDIIKEQRQLLDTHRRTLAHYLSQQATLSTAYTPPGVKHGIEEARESIRHIKSFLQAMGVEVEAHPNDEPPSKTVVESAQKGHSSSSTDIVPSLPRAAQTLTGHAPETKFWIWFETNSENLMEFDPLNSD